MNPWEKPGSRKNSNQNRNQRSNTRAAIAAVYCQSSPGPENQFYFWPGYNDRKGQNAIYLFELDLDNFRFTGAPPPVQGEFESVTDLGVRIVMYHNQPCRRYQLFACRGLR